MTLPFRRRHHDAEASHDRARSLWTTAMLDPVEPADEAWLERHLAACRECQLDHERYLADRDLLRSLRGAAPQPPRDLWARTAAAIEREAARGPRSLLADLPAAARFRRLPVGAVSGLLVVLVVVGAALVSRQTVIPPLPSAGSFDTAGRSDEPVPTPLLVTPAQVRWLRAALDGSYELVVADVDQVCPDERSGCPDLEQSVQAPIKFGGRPIGVTLSPEGDEIAVISAAESGQPAKIIVVTVPEPTSEATPEPSAVASPTIAPTTPPATDAPTFEPTGTPAETPSAAPTPVASPPSSATPTTVPTEPGPQPTPENAREIASGVEVVGDALYSANGQWLAFSARPSDGSTGPDLYLWRAGTDAAVAVTTDHRTYFSSWLGNQVLASRVELPSPGADPSADPGADSSADPSAAPTPDTIDEPSPAPTAEARPMSFLLDPETLQVSDLAEPDVWLPVVDPSGTLVVYWSGTVNPSADGLNWQPAVGRVVLDRWSGTEVPPAESGAPSVAPTETAGDEPAESAGEGSTETEPGSSVGPAGDAVVLVEGPIVAFDARFDPEGRYLGLWTLDAADEEHGRLQLLVVDPETGTVDREAEPLKGVPALRGFSIKEGRLAWVTPPGQDGNQSSVQVLAWKDHQFGHVQTIPARELLVLR